MSMVKARINLNAADFPLLSGQFGKTVLIPAIDQTYIRAPGFMGTYDKGQVVGVPQPYYLHNVVPTLLGYQSIGYEKIANAFDGVAVDFNSIYTLRDVDENKVFMVPANGKNYILRGAAEAWAVHQLIGATATNNYLVTVAYLHEKTYICYKGLGIYMYDVSTDTISQVTITGLDAATITGITAANNYLIAWTNDTVYWSSSSNETDFTPSLSTSAGSEKLQQAKGKLVAALPLGDGFIVYTTANAVAAIFSGNAQFPWIFREVNGSSGVTDKELVTYDANYDYHYAWTTDGLQQLSKDSAQLAFPEITDFIAGRKLEDYDIASGKFTTTVSSHDWKVKVVLVGNRYLVVSYGINELTHALIYDIGLKRWGKLRITHVDCFDALSLDAYIYTEYARISGTYAAQAGKTYASYNTSNLAVTEPDRDLVFLNKYGELYRAAFDQSIDATDAVIILGKFQLSRNKSTTLQEIDVESVSNGTSGCTVIGTIDGKNEYQRKDAYLFRQAGYLDQYRIRMSGENLSIQFKGNFDITSVQLGLLPGGDR